MNTMQICNQKIQVKEYNGQRVVTFRDIDIVHERPDGTAKAAFVRNRERFTEGTDFFSIIRKEFRTLYVPNEKLIGNPNVSMFLITESGYLMLAKVFDDLAWRVQRELVNCYFKIQAIKEMVRKTTASDDLTVEQWLQIGEMISRTPLNRMKYLQVALRRLCPKEFGTFNTPKQKKSDDDFGRRIAQALQENGLMQKDLAEILDCAKSTISHYIHGKSKPQGQQLQRIVEILNIVY